MSALVADTLLNQILLIVNTPTSSLHVSHYYCYYLKIFNFVLSPFAILVSLESNPLGYFPVDSQFILLLLGESRST